MPSPDSSRGSGPRSGSAEPASLLDPTSVSALDSVLVAEVDATVLSVAEVLVDGAVGVVPESVDVSEVEMDVDVVVRELEMATWLP